MNNKYFKYAVLLLILAITGCSVEKPLDASNTKASDAWIKSSLKKAGKTPSAEARSRALITAYTDAGELGVLETGAHASQLRAIPKQVHTLSMQTKSLDGFKWAIGQGVTVDTSYHELLKFWKLGADWQDYIVGEYPEKALPVFMSQAADTYNVRFLDTYIQDFKATGYKVKSPLETTEFNIRFCHFLSEELDEALQANDRARIEFLVDNMPPFPSVKFIDRKTKETMQALGEYVFVEQKDEALALKLIALEYEYNRFDISQTGFSQAFIDALKGKPDYIVRFLQLDQWEGALSDANAVFILALPADALQTVHKLHIDKAIESGMKTGDSDGAIRLIQWKDENKPLDQGGYIELMNWSLEYGDQPVFEYVMEQCAELNLFSIDFSLLAKNQKLFMQYAPMIMKKVYYTMETHPRKDGTTIGRIKQVFGCGNEDAGLFLVHKYNLSAAWVKATKGQTLLMDVCDAGNLKAARYLIEKRGADLRAETGYSELQISVFGSTRPTEGKLSPIFFAAKSGNPELIKYLVSKGADVNARSNFHTTPLMHAVSAGHLDAVKMLIALRASVNAQMRSGLNSVDLRQIGSYDEISNAYRRAQASGSEAMLNVLKDAGARP